MANSVRRRAKDGGSNTSNLEGETGQPFIPGAIKPSKTPTLSPTFYLIYLISFGSIIFFIALYFNDLFPSPNRNTLDGFVADRAIEDLTGLVKIGPKVTGSEENEVMAIDYLMKIINNLSKSADPIHKFEVDLQKVSGSLSIWDVGLHYNNVQNIVVKIGPRNNASLLINCHFDSVPNSPGASDDGLNCAVMLEVLRIISSSKVPLSYGVIFLFNGAEENPLLASHGFITQHKWAKEVRAFINLESCGAGGHEMLFQTGPSCSWIVEGYAKAALHPSGNVIGEEIFQSGIIPSDTDFRIFRDYGHIPGLDFAHCSDGYVYHTNKDDLKSIVNMPGVIQHTGDNLLAMVLSFTGNNSKLGSLNSLPKENSIYFDVFGLFFISYSEKGALLINCTTVLASVVCILLLLRTSKKSWILVDLGLRSCALFIGLLVSLMYNLLLAVIMDTFSAPMTWFTYSFYLIPLYIVPTIMITTMAITLSDSLLFREKNQSYTENALVPFLPTQLFWTVVLLVFMVFKLRSAFLCVTLVLPPAIAFILLTLFFNRDNASLSRGIYFISTCFTSVLIVYFGILALRLFLPITGRAGPNINPDLPISVLVTLLTFAAFSYICCFSTFLRKIPKPFKFIFIFHVVIVIGLLFSGIGFPFSAVTPQRMLITDVVRNGSPVESLIWIEPLERRGVSVLPELKTLPNIKQFCNDLNPHCGLPWVHPKIFMKGLGASRWIPSTPHDFKDMTQLQVLSDDKSTGNFRTISLNITGPDHMTLMVHTQLVMTNWSIDDTKPPALYTSPTGKSYVVRHVHGLHTPSWTITLKFQNEEGNPIELNKSIHIDLVGHHTHGKSQTSPNLRKFMSTLPSWVHATPLLATVKAYKL